MEEASLAELKRKKRKWGRERQTDLDSQLVISQDPFTGLLLLLQFSLRCACCCLLEVSPVSLVVLVWHFFHCNTHSAEERERGGGGDCKANDVIKNLANLKPNFEKHRHLMSSKDSDFHQMPSRAFVKVNEFGEDQTVQ